eukprot:m51a1_g3703 hypothetical protein (270) ;mRNA; f:415941-419169
MEQQHKYLWDVAALMPVADAETAQALRSTGAEAPRALVQPADSVDGPSNEQNSGTSGIVSFFDSFDSDSSNSEGCAIACGFIAAGIVAGVVLCSTVAHRDSWARRTAEDNAADDAKKCLDESSVELVIEGNAAEDSALSLPAPPSSSAASASGGGDAMDPCDSGAADVVTPRSQHAQDDNQITGTDDRSVNSGYVSDDRIAGDASYDQTPASSSGGQSEDSPAREATLSETAPQCAAADATSEQQPARRKQKGVREAERRVRGAQLAGA